ncbi:MAG TPA: glutamine--fructose-6-phosphate transaminase (isomerizing) [Bacteroidales bacterium]|jgi:glucosamine--fructose-6-phosphate aminotransferase (isomerizing)|nr:glutamine--fructose-6-phosphate transaminase (isomerizing) [Bacteroidales bacterium]HPS71898.1 glutamine--fructose-6-phosphate transaminase (isomerizing) [Bacteroidales bacterium]
MCGIVAYTGSRNAYPILINGLKRLEYRGYDSAGVALMQNGQISLYKCRGKVADLEAYCSDKDTLSNIGIAHTRWATHGEPNYQNAHPHLSVDGKLALIHNGIIENYLSLKKELTEKGYEFLSNTDTEVLVHLVQDIAKTENVDLVEAVQLAMSVVIGTYAVVILSSDHPQQLIVAKKGSPLLIGIGKNEYFVGSDGAPMVEFTNKVVYLEDEEVAVIHPDRKLEITNIRNEKKKPFVERLEMKLEQLEKGGFEHFMLKEIFEQPKAISDSMRGRINTKKDVVALGGIIEYESKMLHAGRYIIAACGTSWHAGLVAEHLFESLVRVPVEVEYASEFRYRNPIIRPDDVLIVISQSGETADTLAAIELAKSKGATVIGICNVVGSSIARNTHAGSYTHAGPEIGVASTKAFTAQVTVLFLMALSLARKKGEVSLSMYHHYISELEAIPAKIESILAQNEYIKEIAHEFVHTQNAIYLGRGVNFPVALEGALKLKEISYIHAEGYPAAEMKHGPIALIDKFMPVVVIATEQETYDKVVSNVQEVKTRNGKIISIVSEGDEIVKSMSDYCIEIPKTDELLSPLVASIPLQLLAYHIAVARGCDVDKPRNLAKSVSVE